jgi:predicted adenylyl cyclase CyaB
MPNIELKCRYPDLSKARFISQKLGGKYLWKDCQVDTYFNTVKGKMKLRESLKNGSELLPYIKIDQQGLRRSDYAKIPIGEPNLVKHLLSELLGTKFEVRKNREVYLIKNVRIHLDEVEHLGVFLEFEAVFQEDSLEVVAQEREKVLALMGQYGISDKDLLDCSYPELMSSWPRP